ncbi:MAG: hypothetical protein AABY01_02405 [Nanoarchaeota archaeon]
MITIEIVKDDKALHDHMKASSDEMMAGHIENGKNELVMTAAMFVKMFSPKRLELLYALRKGENVTELAHRLNRPFEVVHKDLQLFKVWGLVKMRKEKRSVYPTIAQEIRMPVIHAS